MDLVYSVAMLLAVAAVIVLIGQLVHRLGPRHGRLGPRGLDWATSLGISLILSFVAGLVLTVINVGIGSVFPAAFLRSFVVGLLVSTPTAYFVVPRVRALVSRAAAPESGGSGT